jgi:cytochrome c oxidase subunit 2
LKKLSLAALVSMAATFGATIAYADQPEPWEWRFQAPATDLMAQIEWFEGYTLWFIIPIVLLVLGLLLWVMIRYREGANPTPSRTSHNSLIEVLWTVGPIIVLLFIAVPSFEILTNQLTPPKNPDITLKATGHQWYWSYEYQDSDNPLSFDSLILAEGDRADAGKTDVAEYPRLLAVDNEVVLPVNETVRLLVTGADVIHSFAIPAFGMKLDAIPGRLNEAWFKPDRTGLFYGQCSELCGKDHAFMPLAVRVVTAEQYKTWRAAADSDVGKANRALMAVVDTKNKVASAGLATASAE